MSGVDDSTRVASVGSPSTNYEVTLELNDAGRETPLVGAMLALENPMGEGSELALGTVTEVTTRNRWHEDSAFRGAARSDGQIAGLSGDIGDTRTATIRLQAAWRREDSTCPWKSSGPNLRMSPATGTPVSLVEDSLIRELTQGIDDLHYMGELAGTRGVRLPFNIPDFSGPMGAWHLGVYGQSGSGKAMALDTPIPTPSGWTTMGEVQSGDVVFDDQGNPTLVVKAHEVLRGRECFEVVFSDGSTVVVDAEHMWETETAYSRARQSLERTGKRKRRRLIAEHTCEMLRAMADEADPLEVISIAEVLALPGMSKHEVIVKNQAKRVGVAGTVKPVRVANYSGGEVVLQRLSRVWPELEAGSTKQRNSLLVESEKRAIIQSGSAVTVYPKATLLAAIASRGSSTWRDQRNRYLKPAASIDTTRTIKDTLRTLGKKAFLNHAVRVAQALNLPEVELPVSPYLLGDWLAEGSREHIPDVYLRSSIAQRRDLLAGLLDADGTVGPRGTVQFDNTNRELAYQVRELAVSLGYRATVTQKWVVGTGPDGEPKEYGWSYRVSWTTDEPVFRLTRKKQAHAERTLRYNASKNSYRYIVDVRPVESVPVRCITVDSPSHLYLAGETMIPTHNTAVTSFYLAGQLRHENMGIVVVDPQGQWSAEQGMVFSLQGFAQELGREVRVRRISTDLRLAKDAPLLTELLQHTQLVKDLGLKSESTQETVWYEVTKALRNREDWTQDDSGGLLRFLLEYLRSDETAERVYNTPDNRKAFVNRLDNVLNDANAFTNALHQFAPIHNLFQETNPSGGMRHDLWVELSAVFDRPKGQPAPVLFLDMSSDALPGMDDEVSEAALRAREILEKDSVKAAVLRNLFQTLKRASEDKFRSGDNLNTMIVLDEAWRYAAPPNRSDEDEIAALSKDLAGYARDTRKFGIGWLYISQSTRSINLDIWDQMTVRFFGYGLSGADLDKMSEIVDDRSALRLYRTFGNPRSTGVYPFLVTGPVSPLAANATPLTLHVYTDFDEFRADNYAWLKSIRDSLGLPLASGLPVAPSGSSAGPKTKLRGRTPRNRDAAIIESSKTARENRKAAGLKDASGFADPLAGIDDDVPF